MMKLGRIKSGGGAAKYYTKEDYPSDSTSFQLSEEDGSLTPVDGAVAYFTSADYVGNGFDPGKSSWMGKGAEALGLTGEVNADDLQQVLLGLNPDPEGIALSKVEELVRADHAEKLELQNAGPTEADLNHLAPPEGEPAAGDAQDQKQELKPWAQMSAAERIEARMKYEAEHDFKHDPGREALFTIDKSVSIMALAEGGDSRLKEAFHRNVQETLEYMEEHFSVFRVRTDEGREYNIAGNLIVAKIPHATNREADPHLHEHALIANSVLGEDGKFHALVNKELYKYQNLAGMILQAKMRHDAIALGHNVEDGPSDTFRLADIPRSLVEQMSSRTQQIEQHKERMAEEKGAALSHDEIDVAKNLNKKEKVALNLGELRAAWTAEAAAADVDISALAWAAHARGVGKDLSAPTPNLVRDTLAKATAWALGQGEVYNPNDPDQALRYALSVASDRQTVTNQHAIMTTAMKYTGNRLEPEAYMESKFWNETNFMKADKTQLAGLTTKAIIELEQRIHQRIVDGQGRSSTITDESADRAIAQGEAAMSERTGKPIKLNTEQNDAVRTMLTSDAKYVAIPGPAGTGKTTMMAVFKTAYEATRDERELANGSAPASDLWSAYRRTQFKVEDSQGPLILAPKKQLVEDYTDVGIEALTSQKFLRQFDRAERNANLMERMKAQMQGRHLHMDEVSMLSNGEFDRLTRAVEKLGVDKFTYSGDKRQLAAMEAGAPMKMTTEDNKELVQAPLTEIFRQKDPTLLEAVTAMSQGDSKGGMNKIKPFVHETGTTGNTPEARNAIADKVHELWKDGGREAKIIVDTHQQGQFITSLVRNTLRSEGNLTGSEHRVDVLAPKNLGPTEMLSSRNYQGGEVIHFYSDQGRFKTGEELRVKGFDHNTNSLSATNSIGRQVTLRLNAVKHYDGGHGLSVYTDSRLAVAQGEQIVFSAAKPDSGVVPAREYEVTAIDADKFVLRLKPEEGKPAPDPKDVQDLELKRDDPSVKYMTYGYYYTADKAQGLGFNKVIAAISAYGNAEFDTHARVYVMMSRAKEFYAHVTDNFDLLMKKVGENTGMNLVGLQELTNGFEKFNPMNKKKGDKEADPIELNIIDNPKTPTGTEEEQGLVKDKGPLSDKGVLRDEGAIKMPNSGGNSGIDPNRHMTDGAKEYGDKVPERAIVTPERSM